MKKLWIVAFLLAFLGTSAAEQRLQGWCEVGGQKVITQGLQSANTVQVSYPQCLVTVYITGTLTKATLHANNSGGALANPFPANLDGSWGFYTANGRYDIVLSKTASSGFPFTISDVIFCDGCGGGGGGGSVTSVGVSATNTGLAVAGSPVTSSGTIALTSTASAANQTIITTAAATNAWADLPDCPDVAGQHWNFNATTHQVSCGTSSTGGTGTVTSVGLIATGTGFSVSGSPVTTSGSFTLASTSTAANQTLISTAAGTLGYSSLPDCPDVSGQHWNFNATTHQVSCGTSSGAAGNLINFRGTWDGSTGYAQNDGVLLNGSSYVALTANTGVQPGTDGGVTWQLIAQAGTNGVNGVNGTNGANGAPGTPGYSPNQIVAGCGVNYNSGLNFTVQPCTYLIQNTQYSAPLTTVTGTAADPSLPRIDAIVASTSGAISIVAGTPASTPAPPSLDITTQLQVTFYTVDAGATVPTNVTTTAVYINNAEWGCASTANINCASTNNPYSATLDIEATSAVTGNNARLTIPSGTFDSNNFTNLNFFIRSKAAWAATRSLTIQLYNGTTARCTPVTLRDGNFTFNSAITANYQLITIPMSVFACGGNPMTQIRFTVAGTGGNLGFYIDNVTLQGGLTPASGSAAMIWKGLWSGTTAYAVNDVVASAGNAYVAIQSSTNLTPATAPGSWQQMTTFAPGGVDGNLQYKAGNTFAGLNTVLTSSNITFPVTITAPKFISNDTVNNTEVTFTTGSSGDSTCPTPLAGTSYLCMIGSTVQVSQNGAAYAPLATGGGSVTSVAATGPIVATPAPITGAGTISCPTCAIGPGTSVANHVAKFSGTDGVTLIDGGAGGSGTVTSVTFTGDGTVLSNTPSTAVTTTGTLTAILAVAGAGTVLNNATSSSAAPTYTAAVVLGQDNVTAGSVTTANGTSAAHTIWASGATTTNTVKGPATAVTSGNLIDASTSSTTTTLHDSGVATANVVTSSSTLTSGQLVAGNGSKTVTPTNLSGAVTTSGSAVTTLAARYTIKDCEIAIGDPGAASPALADDNDSPAVCGNDLGADYTITAVACWANAGSPTVTPILTGGSGTSILTGALTCGTASWAAGTVNGTPTVHAFNSDGATCASTPCTVDDNITTAGGTAKYIVIRIKRVIAAP